MKILCIGDVYGDPGRKALSYLLPPLVEQQAIDFVLVNVDNAAGGKGITDKIAEEILKLPIDCITTGNHVWEQPSIFPHLEKQSILRPLNLVEKGAGHGFCILSSKKGFEVCVVHVQGRVFMEGKGPQMRSPLRAMDDFLAGLKGKPKIILVDVHAEATAEKKVLAWYLDGRVSAVVGTHTHVQTADEEILPKGTAFITDVGMTGPHHSVIGMDVPTAVQRFLSDGQFKKFKVAEEDVRMEGLLIDIDEETGFAKSVLRVRKVL